LLFHCSRRTEATETEHTALAHTSCINPNQSHDPREKSGEPTGPPPGRFAGHHRWTNGGPEICQTDGDWNFLRIQAKVQHLHPGGGLRLVHAAGL